MTAIPTEHGYGKIILECTCGYQTESPKEMMEHLNKVIDKPRGEEGA